MHRPTVLAVLLTACATPAPPPTPGEPLAPDATEPAVRMDTDAERVVVELGPFDVPAMQMGHAHETSGMAHGSTSPLMLLEWPVEGWLQGFQVRLLDRDGHPVPRDVLHHLIGVNFDRRQLVYPVPERFMGIGTETEDVQLPESLAVPMERGQRLGLYASWHNDTGEDLNGLFIQVTMDLAPEPHASDVRAVLPVYFDTNNEIGGSNAFDLPPGPTTQEWEFTVPVDGELLAASGHLHDYGRWVRIEDAQTGEPLFTLDAELDEGGHIHSVEQRLFRKWLGLRSDPVRLEAGHRYRVVGHYESPLDSTLVQGAMAHVVGVFAPDDLDAWPELERGSTAVEQDLAALPPPLEQRGPAPRR